MSEDEAVERRPRRRRSDHSEAEEVGSKKSSITPARIITWCIFAVIFVILGIEIKTRLDYNATVANLAKLFDDAEKADTGGAPAGATAVITEETIRKQLVGSPHHTRGADDANRIDVYAWKFLLKRYAVRVQYNPKLKFGEPEAFMHETVDE